MFVESIGFASKIGHFLLNAMVSFNTICSWQIRFTLPNSWFWYFLSVRSGGLILLFP